MTNIKFDRLDTVASGPASEIEECPMEWWHNHECKIGNLAFCHNKHSSTIEELAETMEDMGEDIAGIVLEINQLRTLIKEKENDN